MNLMGWILPRESELPPARTACFGCAGMEQEEMLAVHRMLLLHVLGAPAQGDV